MSTSHEKNSAQERQQFLLEEFRSLREEIKEIKSRIFQIVGFGLLILPAAETFARNQAGFESVLLVIPVLVIVVALLYLSESQELMRCGKYIRENIEPEYGGGWEAWLEHPAGGAKNLRQAEKYVSYCFHILFSLYYAAAVFLATRYVLASAAFKTENDVNGHIFLSIMLGFYVAGGLCFVLFLFTHLQSSTGASNSSMRQSKHHAPRNQVRLT